MSREGKTCWSLCKGEYKYPATVENKVYSLLRDHGMSYDSSEKVCHTWREMFKSQVLYENQ